MNHSTSNRRDFLRRGFVLGAAGVALPRAARARENPVAAMPGFGLSLASYTFRKFDLAVTLGFTRRVGIDHICLKSFHLELDSPPEECSRVATQCRTAGVPLWAGGVITMRTEEQVNQAFNYAKAAGMRCIVGVPYPEVLPLVERQVRSHNISVAIHNHGPGDALYPLPQDALRRIRELDPRIGVCIDVGHTTRIGGDVAEAIRACGARVLDVHLKDVTAAEPAAEEVEIGRGIIDIPGLLRALRTVGYRGYLSFEHEKDPDDPLPGLAESVGYVRGVLAVLDRA